MKNFKELFKSAARSKKLTSSDMIIYHALVAYNAKSPDKVDIMKSRIQSAFTPKRGYDYESAHRAHENTLRILNAKVDNYYAAKIFGVKKEELFADSEELNEFIEFFKKMTFDFDRHYTYVFVRQDIFPEYQLVQAAHATMVAGQNLDPKFQAGNMYFTVCGVENESELKKIHREIRSMNHKAFMFYEPDIKSYTALAISPIHWKEKGDLKRFPLLKFSSLQ